MVVVVEVLCPSSPRPPLGTPVDVQVRDTALADTEAPLVGQATTEVVGERSSWLVTVDLDIDPEAVAHSSRLTIFAHADVDKDGRISSGDYITTQSFPLELASAGETRAQVSVVGSPWRTNERYDSVAMHRVMVADEVRTNAFRTVSLLP